MGLDTGAAIERLRAGELELVERMPWSSNATFFACVRDGADETPVIYKPQRGERPLWDFPPGTLCLREMAAFEVSESAGWRIVPPTVLRDGPFGHGMVQLFVDHDPDEHFLELRDDHGETVGGGPSPNDGSRREDKWPPRCSCCSSWCPSPSWPS